jgi:hypothetical protein
MSRGRPQLRRAGRTWRRPISRSRRRRTFRSTIECRCLGTTAPKRGRGPLPALQNRSRGPARCRRPDRKRATISAPRRILAPRGYRSRRCPAGSSPQSEVVARAPLAPGPTSWITAGLLRAHPHGELVATLLPATRQNLPAGLGGHPGPEAVLVEALAIARSVGGLHGFPALQLRLILMTTAELCKIDPHLAGGQGWACAD